MTQTASFGGIKNHRIILFLFVALLAIPILAMPGYRLDQAHAEDAATDPVALIRSAWEARDRQNYQAALARLDSAARLFARGPDLAFVLNERSVILRLSGQKHDALAAATAARDMLDGATAPADLRFSVLMNLSFAARDLWELDKAHQALVEATGHTGAAQAWVELAALALQQGHYADAEAATDRAKGLQTDDAIATRIAFLRCQSFLARRRPADAAAALADLPPRLPPEAASERQLLNGRIALQSGDPARAEALFDQVLAEVSPDSRLAASALYNLAERQFLLGHYARAEEFNQRAELAYRRLLGPDHPVIGQIRHRIGVILQQVGDPEGALIHYDAALALIGATLGPDHPLTWATRVEMSRSLSQLTRHDEAVAILRAALESPAAGRAENDAAAILVRAGLGLALKDAGRADAALAELRIVRHARETTDFSPSDEPPGLNALAELSLAAGDVAGARAAANRSLSILGRMPGSGIDMLGEARRLRADIALAEGDGPTADRLIAANVAAATTQMADLARSDAYASDFAPMALRRQIAQALDRLWQPDLSPDAAEAMFRAAQVLHLNEVTRASAGALVAAEQAADPELAAMLRQRQQLSEQIRALSATIAGGGGLPEESLAELVRMQDERRELDEVLNTRDDRAARLMIPTVVPAIEVSALLAPDEAVWLHAVTDDHSYLFWLTAAGVSVARSDIGAEVLATLVTRLRETLDQGRPEGLQPFDLETSAALYQALFGPFHARLDEVRRLITIPDGAAQQLALGVLVRDPGAVGTTPDGGDARYLGLSHALNIAPSISSFVGLRALGPPRPGQSEFNGFGDPVLERPRDGGFRGSPIDRLTGLARAGAIGALFEPLPETADELRAMASSAHGAAPRIFLGPDASEPVVKSLAIGGGTLAFATHAIVAGDFDNLNEPALILTPPAMPDTHDDGLLTVSEIARLDLAVDMVILSACNTGSASGREGAPGLSGLASGFFTAGARSVVVSHWTILSASSIVIMPPFFRIMSEEDPVPPSEAMRRAMVAVSLRRDHPGFAHPAVWGPFSVVGAY